MSNAALPTVALGIIALAIASGVSPVRAAEPAAPGGSAPAITHLNTPTSATPGEFRRAIRALESSGGAYAVQLPEYLDGLGLDLQRSGRHAEAIEAFKRGVHLARINEGLYTPAQIPLLKREITSYLALGEYAIADDRENYLYRVQMRNLESGPARAEALVQQAQWQYSAYQLGLGGDGFDRLLRMWDLYSAALDDIAQREGHDSPGLVAPLQGMLRTLYLVAGYDPVVPEYGFAASDSFSQQSNYNRIAAWRAQCLGKGEEVIQSIYDLQVAQYGQHSPQAAEARALQGDWLMYNGQRGAAEEAYRQAVGELLPREDAEIQVGALFGQPEELLKTAGVEQLPEPVEAGDGALVLQFAVSDEGRVTDLERVDASELDDGTAHRIMRAVSQARFRPRIALAGPVDTEHVVRAYDIE